MAAKSKKQKQRRSAGSALDRVKRLLEREDYKQALKESRAEYRQNPTSELRCFLEHAYVGRAQQLLRHGQREDARRIVGELRELGVSETSVQAALPELMLSVGLLDQLSDGEVGVSANERERLEIKAADLAVLHPEMSPRGMPEIQNGSRAVREALAALESGNEARSTACLKDLPRQSPFADWKFFVRGLAAYYRHDTLEMSSNWLRLDANRPAARIAAPLRLLAGETVPDQDGARAKLSRLEKVVSDGPVLNQLSRLRQAVADENWKEACQSIRQVRNGLVKLDANLYTRALSWLTGIFVGDGMVNELEQLARTVDGPPHDPRWNRALAMACDESEYDEEDDGKYWRRYLHDLDKSSAFSPHERNTARGLVFQRLAGQQVYEAEGLRLCHCGADHSTEIDELETGAMEAFEQALSFLPAHFPVYEELTDFLDEAGREDEIAGAYQRMLEHAPDNVDALLSLTHHWVERNEHIRALEFAQRARRQKPLDKKVRELVWTCHVGAARHLALDGQFDQAREHFASADQIEPERKNDYDVLARKAVLEIKAGCTDAAREYILAAENQLKELTAFWMAMTIQSNRYRLPKEETWLYEKRWQESIKRRCESETAGLMCKMLYAHLITAQEYPNRSQHIDIVLKYVRRCSRVRWQADDLLSVCDFLQEVRDNKLLQKYVKQGLRKCPDRASFHALSGILEMQKGPWKCRRTFAGDALRKAIRLHEDSPNPREKQVIEQAKHSLRILEQYDANHNDYGNEYEDEYDEVDNHFGRPPDIGPGGPSPMEIIRMIQDISNKMGIDPQDLLDEIGGGSNSQPAPRGRRKGKS